MLGRQRVSAGPPSTGALQHSAQVFLDLGCSVGVVAMVVKTWFPDARVVCIEGDPLRQRSRASTSKSHSNRSDESLILLKVAPLFQSLSTQRMQRYLRWTLRENGFEGRVEVVPKLVGRDGARETVTRWGDAGALAPACGTGTAVGKRYVLEEAALPTLLRELGIARLDAVKMDCEGCEYLPRATRKTLRSVETFAEICKCSGWMPFRLNIWQHVWQCPRPPARLGGRGTPWT